MKRFSIFAAIVAAVLAVSCKPAAVSPLYGFSVVSNNGENVDFSQYKGKVLLIANTASKCGFTPQYEGLQALWEKYKDKGLVVIGFPCDQFGHQEPGTAEEIEEFCTLNYGVTFPLMAKSDVNGENANPVFKWLYGEKPFESFGEGERAEFMTKFLASKDPEFASNPDIKWNFTKFLVDRKGNVVARFEPTASPADMESAIVELLD